MIHDGRDAGIVAAVVLFFPASIVVRELLFRSVERMAEDMTNKPVATLVTVVTFALALLTALAGTGVLPAKWAAVAAGVIAVLNAVLGAVAHGKVTPVANPKDSSGRPLVPR